jgi:pimeloyl-ACP methyl ester carboxylesterase
VLGGSWGVALALAYAQAHPGRVGSLVLRGVCAMTPREVSWMYAPPASGGGAAALRPLQHAALAAGLPPRERANPLLGWYRRLLSGDADTREVAVSGGPGIFRRGAGVLLCRQDVTGWRAALMGHGVCGAKPPLFAKWPVMLDKTSICPRLFFDDKHLIPEAIC